MPGRAQVGFQRNVLPGFSTASPPSNPFLPDPNAAGRISITTADTPQTIIAANPGGSFVFEPGVYNGVTIHPTAANADILCKPGVVFNGGNAAIPFLYAPFNGVKFRGWDNSNPVEVYGYKQTANDTSAIIAGPQNADSWTLATGWRFGYINIHDCGVVNIRPGNQGYLGYSISSTAYGLAVGGGGMSSASNPGIIEYCTFEKSNTSNIDPGNQGGESKFVCDWMIVRHCIFQGYPTHSNPSPSAGVTHDGYGLWLDVDCTNYVLDSNTIQDIYRGGLIVEISGRGVISNNIIRRVGFRQSNAFTGTWGSTFGAGIQISSSGTGPNVASQIDIFGNTLTDCYEGIAGYWDPRGHWQRFAAEHALANMSVHNNSLLRCGPSGMLYSFPAWASGVAYGAGTGAEQANGSHVSFNNRIYRCILAHTSSAGTQPTGAATNNTWWNHQSIVPTDTSSVLFTANNYVNCGASDSHVGNAGNFYRTGSFPTFANWQAFGQDIGGSFTGSPGYVGS